MGMDRIFEIKFKVTMILQSTKILTLGFILVFLILSLSFATQVSTGLRWDNWREILSREDLCKNKVILQTSDFTCGAAALATLINCYLGGNTTEEEILSLSEEADSLRGVSFLGLKKAAEAKGYITQGFRLDLSILEKLNFPVLVFLQSGDRHHFMVVQKINRQRIFLADPGRGCIRMSHTQFIRIWQGETLIVLFPDQKPPLSPEVEFLVYFQPQVLFPFTGKLIRLASQNQPLAKLGTRK